MKWFCVLLISSGLALGSATEARAAEVEPIEAAPPYEAPSAGRRALAGAALLIPGLLVHGSGAYVMGDSETAKNLLITEGVGLGLGGISVATILLSGASEQVVSPGIAAGVLGLGLFATTLLADVYAVTAPRGGFGGPEDVPWLEVSAGYQGVYNPALDTSHYASVSTQARLNHLELAGAGWFSGEGHRVETDLTWRIWGRRFADSAEDNSFLGLRVGHTNDTTIEDTALNLFELEVVSRLDLEHFGPSLDGSFADMSIGYAGGWDSYAGVDEVDYASLLLGRFAFGLYFGHGGEVALFYQHRHDGFAGGLKLDGKISGFAGSVGAESVVPVWGRWKVFGDLAIGSAVVGNIGLKYGW